jgi:hypothetical protein
MANTIDATLVDRIYAMGLTALRKKTSLLRNITRYDRNVDTPSFRGDTLVIPMPGEVEDATDVVPSNTPPVPGDITPGYASITLNQHKKTDFHLTDVEVSKLQAGTMSSHFTSAIDKLAKNIVQNVWGNYTGIYQYAGTVGTTPFASNISIATTARKILNNAGVPMEDRSLIMNFDAEANALQLSLFQQYLQKGDTETLREGMIYRAMGMDWETDAYLPTFTGGTLSNGSTKSALINSAAVTVGQTSVPMDSATLTGTVIAGDLFTVAGDDQQYVVTANATAAGNAITVSFDPPAKVAWADNAVVTFVANHDVAAIAMHPEAFAFASRRLDNIVFHGGNMIRSMYDPASGLTLTLEISRQYHQTVAEFSCLWGSTLMRPECAVRILG